MVRILYYRAKCIGCGGCVEAAPEHWYLSRKDGKCTLIHGTEKKGIFQRTLPEEEKEAMTRAANNCPLNIIKLITWEQRAG